MPKATRAPALPGKLWIGTFEVPLKVVPPHADELKDENGVESNGMSVVHDEDLLGIWIASNLPPRKRLEIVIHEVIHIINFAYGIEDDDAGRPICEEDVAEKHGKAWTQLYLDNPRFVKWLTYVVDKIRKDQKAHTDAEATEPETPRDPRHPDEAGGSIRAAPLGGPLRGGEEA